MVHAGFLSKDGWGNLHMKPKNFAFSFLILAICSTLNSGCEFQTQSPPPDASPSPLDDGQTKSCNTKPVEVTHSPDYVPSAQSNVFLDLAKYPGARCNDGSPAVYGIRPGFGIGKNRWIIHLEGGGACATPEECAKRATRLTSSRPYRNTDVGIGGGIQSSDPTINPDFYDATVVKIHYCSSDGWMGRRPADPLSEDPLDRWHWQGHEIVRSVILDLQESHGLLAAKEVILSGGSAGGVGAYMNINRVAAMLDPDVRFLGLPDSGFVISAAAFEPTEEDGISRTNLDSQRLRLENSQMAWRAEGDIDCFASASTVLERQTCMQPVALSQTAGRYKIPLFVHQSLIDKSQLGNHGLEVDTIAANETVESYLAYFAQKMRDEIALAKNSISYFAPNNIDHVVIQHDVLATEKHTFSQSDGSLKTLSVLEAIGQWYRDPCDVKSYVQ